MVKAKYRGIPCWFDLETGEIEGRNWLFDKLIEINIWIDTEIFKVDAFPIWIEEDEPNN